MSKYTNSDVYFAGTIVCDALDDIDARLAALEGKGGGDEYPGDDFMVKLDRYLSEHGLWLVSTLDKARLMDIKTAAPTKRQQVAEAFLHAAETWALFDMENEWADLAKMLERLASKPGLCDKERALLTSMMAVLDDAAREGGECTQ